MEQGQKKARIGAAAQTRGQRRSGLMPAQADGDSNKRERDSNTEQAESPAEVLANRGARTSSDSRGTGKANAQ